MSDIIFVSCNLSFDSDASWRSKTSWNAVPDQGAESKKGCVLDVMGEPVEGKWSNHAVFCLQGVESKKNNLIREFFFRGYLPFHLPMDSEDGLGQPDCIVLLDPSRFSQIKNRSQRVDFSGSSSMCVAMVSVVEKNSTTPYIIASLRNQPTCDEDIGALFMQVRQSLYDETGKYPEIVIGSDLESLSQKSWPEPFRIVGSTS